MTKLSSVTWARKPHTEGKHLVLKHYLNAWMPILGSRNLRIFFVDGFAGPGEYEDGVEGSPVVAMRTLADHTAEITAEVRFFFFECNKRRAKHLDTVVDRWRPKLPASTKAKVIEGQFDQSMTSLLDKLDAQAKMGPSFVMIDPFGVKGMPMHVIRRIMENPKCEVYISFMWESIQRFMDRPEFESHLNEMFATTEWSLAKEMEGEQQMAFVHDLYRKQLKRFGAKYVGHFQLFAGNRHKYSVFFGTRNLLGMDRMKKAIWKVAPWGDYSFRGGMHDQLTLGLETPDFRPLRSQIQSRFGGKGWIEIETLIKFMQSDSTIFHDSQLKRPVLRPMEKEGLLYVDETKRNRVLSYPNGCRIQIPLAKALAYSRRCDPVVPAM